MNEIECPYCEESFTDDEYYENNQEELYEIECPKCEKNFMVSYEMDPYFTSHKAPCRNGEEHKWKDVCRQPKIIVMNNMPTIELRCEYCDIRKNRNATVEEIIEDCDHYYCNLCHQENCPKRTNKEVE